MPSVQQSYNEQDFDYPRPKQQPKSFVSEEPDEKSFWPSKQQSRQEEPKKAVWRGGNNKYDLPDSFFQD